VELTIVDSILDIILKEHWPEVFAAVLLTEHCAQSTWSKPVFN